MTRAEDLYITTGGRGLVEITAEVLAAVRAAGQEVGVCTVFCHHTSAALILCENADPSVCADLEAWLDRTVPDGDPLFRHTAEGPDDMPAHVRSVLTQNSIVLPIRGGALDLGTWQGLFLFEHRIRGHRRRVSVTVTG